jgi:glucosyl-dolichyl phosphate glucuronosyltransferase
LIAKYPAMKISVAIPTYNRAVELDLTLASLSTVAGNSVEGGEVLVVDNNSTDETREVVERWMTRFAGTLRYVLEKRLGLCFARNRAIAESNGEVIAFLDDDVDVDPDWLSALRGAYAGADCAAVGGRAYLVYPSEKPSWVGKDEETMLSRVELGDERRRALPGELYGLNLSIRKDWLEQVGGFRTDLDRVGNCLLSGGEKELLQRIETAGGQLWYEPRAVVGHRVPAERLRPEWFIMRRYWGLRSAIRMRRPGRTEAIRQASRLLPSLLRTGAGVWRRRLTDRCNDAVHYDRLRWHLEVKAEWMEYGRAIFCSG